MSRAELPPAPEPPSRPRIPATTAGNRRPPATVTVTDHAAAAAYLMKRARTAALAVLDIRPTGRPVGVITQADIDRAAADGKDLNEVRIHELMAVTSGAPHGHPPV